MLDFAIFCLFRRSFPKEREHRFLLENQEKMKNHRKNLVPLFGLFFCEKKCEIGLFEINLVLLTSVTLVTSHIF